MMYVMVRVMMYMKFIINRLNEEVQELALQLYARIRHSQVALCLERGRRLEASRE